MLSAVLAPGAEAFERLPVIEDAELLRFAGELLRHADPHTPPSEREIRKLLDFASEQEVRV